MRPNPSACQGKPAVITGGPGWPTAQLAGVQWQKGPAPSGDIGEDEQ
jgi:hypothetical protein